MQLARLQGVPYSSIFADIDPVLLPDVLAFVGDKCGQKDLYCALVATAPELTSLINRKALLKDTMTKNTADITALDTKYARQRLALTDKRDVLNKRMALLDMGVGKEVAVDKSEEQHNGLSGKKRGRSSWGLRRNTVGICPSGALGVSVLYHLITGVDQDGSSGSNIVLLDRPSSTRHPGQILVRAPTSSNEDVVDLASHHTPGSFLSLHEKGELPELIAVVCNPDQIEPILIAVVDILVSVAAETKTFTPDIAALHTPVMAFLSNGIFYQSILKTMVDLLEDASEMGKLPPPHEECMNENGSGSTIMAEVLKVSPLCCVVCGWCKM